MAIEATPIAGCQMKSALASYFTKTATILHPTKVQDAYGEERLTFAILEDHEDIPCAVASGDVGIRMRRQEIRTSQTVSELQYRRAMLLGAFPGISLEDHCRIEGYDWNVVAMTVDQTSSFTELLLESLTPSAI